MSAAAGRVAGKVGSAAGKAAGKAAEAGNGKGKESVLTKGAKRDPELYVCPWFNHVSIRITPSHLSPDPTRDHVRRFWSRWVPFWWLSPRLISRIPWPLD